MAKSSAGAKTAVWILMGLLILGLGGFGATSFSSTVRAVGSVGDEVISTSEYGRALQNEMRALEAQTGQAISFDQMVALGIDRQVLSQLVSEAAVDHETTRIGISVGDATLARQLQGIDAFRGIDGKFDRESYRFALERSGLSETEFEDDIRSETARALLQGAVISGRALPDSYIDTVLGYFAETRDITWARVDRQLLEADGLEPSEEELKTIYDAQIEDFTRPELKRITYAWLTPEMLIDEVEIDDDLLRQAYEDRNEIFNRPERRLLERLVYSDAARAAEAKTQLDSGEKTFEDLVTDRGLNLGDIDMGDVAKADLGPAGADVFAAQSGDVVGPIDTDLGAAFFRINGILSAEITPYEDALPDLRQELAADRARREVATYAEPSEDLLASGATLEELAQDTALELGTIEWNPHGNEGIGAYEDFKTAAAALSDGDYPEILYLDDGSIYAMRLDEVIPPKARPFEEVRDRVRGIWDTRRQMERLSALAQDHVAKLKETADFDSLGLETQTQAALTRQGTVLGGPPEMVEQAFGMELGEYLVVDGFGAALIVRLDAINAPDPDAPDVKDMRDGLVQQIETAVGNDLYQVFSQDLRQRGDIEINQQAVAAVNANFQ